MALNHSGSANMTSQSPYDYETRRDMIATHAWEQWTKNGLRMDEEDRRESEKAVQDAVANVYTNDMTDEQWLAATLSRLAI